MEAVTGFDEQVAAIKPFLEDKKIITLGVSYGGALALKAALDFPEKVFGVVTAAALIDEPYDYALRLEKLGGEPGLHDFVPNRWRKVRAEIAGRRTQIAPLLDQLKTLRTPVEVLHGDFDALVSKDNSNKLISALGPGANANLEIVPGGTHYLELQYPRRLHKAIKRIIARTDEAR